MEIKRSDNLCNFYILPLLGLNKLSFGGGSNFINSYISQDNKYMVVEIKDAKTPFDEHQNYVTDYSAGDKTTIVFTIPPEFEETILRFRAGKYSQFSSQVKTIIKQKSGLKYKVPTINGKVTSARELLALDKDKDLKEIWEREIGCKLSDDAELVSIPTDNNYYELNLMTIA